MKGFQVLATPYEGELEQFTAKAADAYTRLVAKNLRLRGERLSSTRKFSGIFESLRAIEESPSRPLFCHRPEVGFAFKTLNLRSTPNQAWAFSSAQFIIGACMEGMIKNTELVLQGQLPLWIAGRSVENEYMKITVSPEILEIRDRNDSVVFRLVSYSSGYGHNVWASEGAPVVLLDGRPFAVLSRAYAGWDFQDSGYQKVERTDLHVSQFTAAIGYVAEVAPEYCKWIGMATRYLVPVERPGPNMIGSASTRHCPGVLRIAAPASNAEVVEMLVHESSHQFYNFALNFGDMCVADAPQVYSALKRTARSLDRVLAGFHAFVNVKLVYEKIRLTREEATAMARYNAAVRYIEELRQVLDEQADASLTEIGYSLYVALRQRSF